MLRKIKLYGELAKFLGEKTLEAEVNNAAQAIRFLVVNFPKLEKHMADRSYRVLVDKWELDKKELHYPSGASDIKIVPMVGGAGGNTGRILLGAALIGASFMFPGAGIFGTFSTSGVAAAGTTLTEAQIAAGLTVGSSTLTTIGSITSAIGASLVLNGIATMLAPIETIPEANQDPRRSFNFSGIQNTTKAGVAVPVIYGRTMTGSVVVSANITNEQVEV
jgi:predicted phage tail protein